MRAHRRKHIRESTEESTHRRAQRSTQITAQRSTQIRAQRSTHMRAQDREAHFVRACAVDSNMDMPKEQVCMEIYKKKRTWTFHKPHFMR